MTPEERRAKADAFYRKFTRRTDLPDGPLPWKPCDNPECTRGGQHLDLAEKGQ